MTSGSDLLALVDFAHGRLQQRLAGVTDDELGWVPTPDPDLTLRWRLRHLAETLGAQRNPVWLGLDVEPWGGEPAATPESVARAYAHFRELLAALDERALEAPIGAAGGPFGQDSRRSFALHVADELIHHGAEAALLRDLYAQRGAD